MAASPSRAELIEEGHPTQGWTLYSLKEHITRLLELQREEFMAMFLTQKDSFKLLMDEAEKRNNQRFDAQQEGVATAMQVNEKAVQAAMAAAEKLGNAIQIMTDKAITKAEAAQYDKNVSMNEIRKMAEDQQNKFAPTSVVNLQIEGVHNLIHAVELQMQQLLSRSQGHGDMWGWFIGFGGLLIAGLTLITFFFKH